MWYRYPDWVLLLGLNALVIAIKVSLLWLAGIELHFDEAQYWEWAQRLDWSYYSKGPLVAWLIAFSTGLLGDGEWQVRLLAWLTGAGFNIAVFYLTLALWQSRSAAWWATALVLTTPLYFALTMVMTTDVFLLLAWTLALWAAAHALYTPQPLAWYGFGAAIGIGGLGKLSIGLLPFFLGFYLLFTRHGRAALLTPHFWGGLLLLFALMSPVWLWNAGHDWVMLRHEVGHVGSAHDDAWWQSVVEFIGGQWLALSPLVLLVGLFYMVKRPDTAPLRLLWGISWLVLVFFVLKACFGKVQPNWAAPAFIGLLVVWVGYIPHFTLWQKQLLRAGMSLSLLLLLGFLIAAKFGFSGSQDPLKKFKAWREPVTAIAAQVPQAEFVITTYYHLATELAFYWDKPMRVYLTKDDNRRHNQYDLWPSANAEAIGKAGAVVTTSATFPASLQQAFQDCRAGQPVTAHAQDGALLRTLHVWLCEDFQGIKNVMPSAPTTF